MMVFMSPDEDPGVHNPRVIDLVAHDPELDEFGLIMVETRPWDGSTQRLLELQAKINAYLSFALDGEMYRLYPESVGKQLRLELDTYSPPDDTALTFIAQVRDKLVNDRIAFVVRILD